MGSSELILRDKIILLEKAVLNGSADEVSALFRELGAKDFSTRALGLACRFRGLDMVKALVECGAVFDCSKSSWFGGFMKIHHGAALLYNECTCRWSDYSLMILEPCRTMIVSGIQPVDYDKDFGYINKAEDEGVLPVSERLKILDYLCGCSDIGFDMNNVYYFSIITDCTEFYGTLKERGAALPEKIRASLIKRGNDWVIFSMILHHAPPEIFPSAVERLAAEFSSEEKIKYSDAFFEGLKNLFTIPKNLELIMEHFDRSKMNKTKILKFLIDNDAAGCFPLLERAGWLKPARRRDEIIQYASDGGRMESTVWLMDFKNRTADFAAERKRAEKKMLRELNADPTSLSEIKKSFRYKKQNDGTLIITSYRGHSASIIVPEKIGDDIVSAIGEYAFSPDAEHIREEQREIRKSITKITLPDTIESIGEFTFSGCISLTHINIPKKLTEISDGMFQCTSLERIVIGGNVRKIGDGAFVKCQCLKTVKLCEGVEKIGRFAFFRCSELESLELPRSLKKIGKNNPSDHPFWGCPKLTVMVHKYSYAEIYCDIGKIAYKYF